MMTTLLQHLREFNRKERFYLLSAALGNQNFCLSEGFRRTLSQEFDLQIPPDAFAAMDYHLDWLAASMYLTANPGASIPYKRDDRLITATQEDIDFLVAYDAEGTCHVIMLESKGVTGFSNRQFRSKVDRLRAMSEVLGWDTAKARPHFALVSPKQPQRLKYEGCPKWMMRPDGQVRWIPLPLPESLKKVVRCDQGGIPRKGGSYWKITTERHGQAWSSKS